MLRLRKLIEGDGLRARLVRSVLGSAGIQVANRSISLGIGVRLARVLGADGYGIYAYAFAIMTLLMIPAQAGVPTLLMREAATSAERRDWGLLRGAITRGIQFVSLIACGVSCAFLLITLLVSDHLTNSMFLTIASMLILLPISAGIVTIVHAITGLQRIILGLALQQLLLPVLALIIIATGFLLWPNLRQPQYAMGGQVLAAMAVLPISFVLLLNLIPEPARMATPVYRSREWLHSAIPFTFIGAALVIHHQTDLIMLGVLSSSEQVGLYRVATQGAMLVAFFLMVFNSILGPRFARSFSKADFITLQRLTTISARAIIILSLPLMLAFLFWGGQIAALVFGVDFFESRNPLVILSLGQFVTGFFGCIGVLMSMSGGERELAFGLWVTSIVNISLNFILIPMYSGTGAAIATSITWVILHLILYRLTVKKINIRAQPFSSIYKTR